MPVLFIKNDILAISTDAIVIPHAPSDRMPWCNYDEFDYWDITLDVFSRADMEKMMNKYCLFRGNGYKIGEDFVDEDDIKKGYLNREKYPEITVTKRCGLPVDCVLHVCVKAYTEYLCETDDYSFCASREKNMLTRCYWMALHCAARLGIKKIAFPLFSTDCPKEIAYEIAHSVPQKWLDENTEYEGSNDPSHGPAFNKLLTLRNKGRAEMEIYIVEPRGIDLDRMKTLRDDLPKHKPFLSEFGQRFEREKAAYKGSEDDFKLDFIQKCFEKYKRKDTFSALAEKAHYSSSDISKLKNGGKRKVNKKKAIELAVAMELNDYERFAFINCTNNKYPIDEMDLLIEELILEGKRDIEELREALYNINEAYDLYGDKD